MFYAVACSGTANSTDQYVLRFRDGVMILTESQVKKAAKLLQVDESLSPGDAIKRMKKQTMNMRGKLTALGRAARKDVGAVQPCAWNMLLKRR